MARGRASPDILYQFAGERHLLVVRDVGGVDVAIERHDIERRALGIEPCFAQLLLHERTPREAEGALDRAAGNVCVPSAARISQSFCTMASSPNLVTMCATRCIWPGL